LPDATSRSAGRRGAGLTAGSDFVIFRGFAAARFVLVTSIAPRLALAGRLILADGTGSQTQVLARRHAFLIYPIRKNHADTKNHVAVTGRPCKIDRHGGH
jgi:hypothetical protein